MKIMLVDDSEIELETLKRAITDSGNKCVSEQNSSKAVSRAIEEQPDVIVLDVMMPGMSGFDVCRAIKTNPETRHIPILFLSSCFDGENVVKGMHLGCVDFIPKPVKVDQFMSTIKDHIQVLNVNKALTKMINQLERTIAQ